MPGSEEFLSPHSGASCEEHQCCLHRLPAVHVLSKKQKKGKL